MDERCIEALFMIEDAQKDMLYESEKLIDIRRHKKIIEKIHKTLKKISIPV